VDAFWQWLTQPGGLISGDWTYYAQGRATAAEYAHAIRTAIGNLAYASDPTAASEFYRRLRETGAYAGDFNYYASGAAQASEVENLINVASGALYNQAQTVASQPPAPVSAPVAPPAPAPTPAPAPVTPPTPTPAPAPPAPEPIDWKARVQALYPWLPASLVSLFAERWSETGDPNLALAEVRASDAYNQAFPGIKRDDGSLRMSEQEWFSTREAYSTLFREFGLNNNLFTDRFTELMEGNVSPSELAGRLGGAFELMNNIPEVRDAFEGLYGVSGGAAVFAWFIDPDLGQAIIDKRVSVAQVAGEGLARGFDTIGSGLAERLVAGGVDQGLARNFFVQAEGQLFTLDQLAQRHRDPDDTFDLEEFAEANIFGDAEQTRRIRRLLRQEASLFQTGGFGQVTTSQDFALTGLTPR
jgi:hypothetical protein